MSPSVSAKKASELIDKFRPSISVSNENSSMNSSRNNEEEETEKGSVKFAFKQQKKIFDQKLDDMNE
jgi:hypothetical protein